MALHGEVWTGPHTKLRGENWNETVIGKEKFPVSVPVFLLTIPHLATFPQAGLCPATSTRKNHGGWMHLILGCGNWLKLGDERPAHPCSK